jgi:hypothetical protein
MQDVGSVWYILVISYMYNILVWTLEYSSKLVIVSSEDL